MLTFTAKLNQSACRSIQSTIISMTRRTLLLLATLETLLNKEEVDGPQNWEEYRQRSGQSSFAKGFCNITGGEDLEMIYLAISLLMTQYIMIIWGRYIHIDIYANFNVFYGIQYCFTKSIIILTLTSLLLIHQLIAGPPCALARRWRTHRR